ncbi:MAG: hypothetical protein KDE47_21735, partial [Caldilineaceae bacterium]|nr:hypothetical protein [Caldilineaceae bacterium]
MPKHYTRWPIVEGYAERQSYLPGEEVHFHCASRAATFSAEVTRVGQTRQTLWRRDQIAGHDHATPDDAYAAGCRWPVTFSLQIPAEWPSGYYEVTLRADGAIGEEAAAQAFFVVRSPKPQPHAHAVLILAANTYNAYNQWGGASLYSGATRVSFARPLERGYLHRPAAPFDTNYDGRIASTSSTPDPDHLQLQTYQAVNNYPLWCASAGWHNWERRFVRWAERAGLQLDYAINSDLEFHPEVLDGAPLMLSVGHDEYWSWAMRDRVDDFVQSGGNWAIFSGNTCFWQVRYEDEGRTMVCYKGRARAEDPVMGGAQQSLLSTMWSSPLIGRPENLSTGLSFSRGGYARIGRGVPRGSGAYTVYRPDHWAFADTELRYGDLLGLGSYIVAYEVDGCEFTLRNGLPIPTHADSTPDDLTILATSPARLLSVTPTYSEVPSALWASTEPPGDLEGMAIGLFGDDSADNVARL